jgi:hypothetical protein
VVLSTDFTDKGLKDNLDDVLMLAYDAGGWEFTDIYDVGPMEDGFEEEAIIQYPDEVEEVAEGGAFTRVDISHVAIARYDCFTFKTELPITMEADMDLKYPAMKNGAKALGIALHRTIERRAAKNFYNGLSSVLSPRDGLSIFNTGHICSMVSGGHPGTWSNRSQLKMTNANVQTRRIAGMKQLDEHGSPFPAKFNQIITGPDLAFKVKEYFGSDMDPDTAQNRTNVGFAGLKPYCMTYFQEAGFSYTSGMWFLRDSEKATNKCKWRMKPETFIEFDPKTRSKLYQIVCRIAFGWTEDHGVDASTGEL